LNLGFFKGNSKRYERQWHPLFIGAERGSIPHCEHVVKRTGDINLIRQIDGFTPLGFAAQEGHLEICAFLIKNLDDKNPEENDGWTPFHHAARNGHLDVCKLMLNHIDKKNPGDKIGLTPLHLASRFGNLEVCAAIIMHLGNKFL
jgi:ankyrin repeat protein